MTEFWREPSLSRFVRRAAQVNGRGLAICAGSYSVTWSEFSALTEAVANGLMSCGLKKGDRVALVSENTHQLLLAWFSVLRAGCVIVPINIRLSETEIEACISDAEASAVFLSTEQYARFGKRNLPACVETVILAEKAAEPGAQYDLDALARMNVRTSPQEASGDETAAIFYTGGTTGGPKGVMLSHGNLVANTANVMAPLGFSRSTRYLHAAPLFHVLETAGTFGVTAAGGCHYFVPRFDASAVAELAATANISATALVPTMIGTLVDQLEPTAPIHSIETLFYGGTAIPEALLPRVRSVLPRARLVQGYGQTETSPTVTLLGDEDHVPGNRLSRSCGVAVPGVEVSLRTPDGTYLRSAGEGEICVRGATVMRSSWKRPVETQETLKNGWLHTGDAGRLDEDGYLFIVDRLKDFIKTGGENVSPSEVENAIHLHSDVAECSVFGIPSERWGEEIVALVHLRPGSAATPADIKLHLRVHLAGFKIPKRVELSQSSLPKSGPGKILRRTVKEQYQAKLTGGIIHEV